MTGLGRERTRRLKPPTRRGLSVSAHPGPRSLAAPRPSTRPSEAFRGPCVLLARLCYAGWL
eukprot:7153259-Pyramimonas_sp.AAC.1